ncbi:protein DpdG [Micromonospora sp. CPCC 205546]|uniref:protein DpdG n=1 Tax=Micromonospora sp. CPCC 205546 TaxID=3122397 RepID=UPI002FF1DD7A
MLNPPDVLPEAMRYLLRAALAHRGGRCAKDELIQLVAPSGLPEVMKPLDTDRETDRDIDGTAASGRLIAEKSLSALAALGIVELERAEVKVAEAALRHWRTPQEVTAFSFSRLLRSHVWSTASMTNEGSVDARVWDLVNAVSVMFAAPEPLRPFDFETGMGRRFDEAQKRWFGQRKSDWPVTNVEQYRSFCRWAPYLGFATPITGRSLVVDASSALLQDLADLPHGRMRASEFVARCAEQLPVSDGGLHTLWKPDDAQELSPGMSMSLRQLEAGGHLTLPPAESDTDTLVVTLGVPGEATRVSHLDWHPQIPAKERS